MKLARVATITKVLLEEGLGWLTESPTEKPDEPARSDADTAVRLRRTLERLGPTFVKFGQMLSTRVDLFGETFTEELGKLQSSVEPFPTDTARQIVERELGRPLDEVFASFGESPVAAASIAQVYRATLRDGGLEVAVKVQRPGLEESLLSDLDTLLTLSGFIDRLVPPYHRAMVHRVAEEYAARARGELDFLAEARAIDRFDEVLTTLPEFVVPTVVSHLCTPHLLVMSWLEGTKLSDVGTPQALQALGYDPEAFCRSMLRLQLSMCYEHGFVHGDTHPGNLILEPAGRIGLVDFGLHAQLPRALRDKMLEVVFCQASRRYDDAVEAFVQVFRPEPGVDQVALKRDLRAVLAAGGEGGRIGDHRITEQLIAGMRVGASYHMSAQSDLFVVLRNLTIVEGIVLRYCPDLDGAAEVRTITGAILRRRLFGPSMREDFTQLLPQLALTISQRPRTAERLLKIERSFNETRSLGDFLREQGVISTEPRGIPAGWVAVGLSVGLALGGVLGLVAGVAITR